MSYFKQVKTVTLWEYRRFFKPKNELLGIFVMILISVAFYFFGRFALADSTKKVELTVLQDTDTILKQKLAEYFQILEIPAEGKEEFLNQISATKEGLLLTVTGEDFTLHSYKKSKHLKKLAPVLNDFKNYKLQNTFNISESNIRQLISKPTIHEQFDFTENSKGRIVLAYFFAGLMLLAVFLSFAYQFVAITGEKQLKITEQIVSAIKPQVWMDGKIFGITLTGLSSMFTYAVLSILGGMIFFQFTGTPVSRIFDFLHFLSVLLYFCFAITGILMWNALLAAIAAMITDPNNSGKSSLMMVPVLFVFASFLVMRDPDSKLSIFLSWFPFTSATAMPMRWAVTEVSALELAGAFLLLVFIFYILRKLAAKIFRISILIGGKEPSLAEIIKMSKES